MTPRQIAAVVAALLGISAILASVGGPAAVASYHHAYQVFVTFGEAEGRAAWLPLTTDGMLAAALVVMYSRRWAKQRVGFVPWLAFAVGLSGTLAANLASARAFESGLPMGEIIGRLSAAVWSPIAFAVTLELVAVMLGKVRDYVARCRAAGAHPWPVTWQVGIPVYPYSPPVESGPVEQWERDLLAAGARVHETPADREPAPVAPSAPARRTRPARTRPVASAPAPASAPGTAVERAPGTNGSAVRWTEQDEAYRMDLQEEADRTGSVPSLRDVKSRYSMGQDRARKILARVHAPAEPVR